MVIEGGWDRNYATTEELRSSNVYRKPNRISKEPCIIWAEHQAESVPRRGIMATTTTPNVETTPKLPVNLTPTAVVKVKEIMGQQNPVPAGLRIGVVGGGCSGFSYSMSFENAPGVMDKVYTFDELKVYVDATSAMYLNGCIVDFVETLEASGFKFENPNVKSTCGCGSSFNV
jgi:iron-sulfur cluster assembly accessory protein